VHTADSSRYWLKDQYEDSFEKGLKQKGLDKEYVRSWLRDNGFTGDGVVPDLPDEIIINASLNVIKAYELITAQKFKLAETYASDDRLMSNLKIFNKK
jgi:phosphoribosylaminoimidazole-succinocarboxamide synthase